MAANPLLITDTNIQGVLKNVYTQYRINAFPLLTPLLANIKKGQAGGPQNMRFGGNGVFWDVVLTRPVGTSASQTGQLPPMSPAKEAQASLGIKRTYVRRQIDALAIQATESKEAAFIPLARKIVQEAVDAGRLVQQETLQGDGLGIKGIVASVTNNTTITVNSPYGISGGGQGGLWLDANMYVAVMATGGGTLRGSAFVTSVVNAGDTATVVFATSISNMVATDIVVSATLVDQAYNQFPNGIMAVTNRGNNYASFEGLTNATYPRWDSIRMAAGTDTSDVNQPSEMDVWELATRILGKSGKNAKVNPSEFLLITTPGIERKFGESFLGQRRFSPVEMTEIKGGFKAVTICGIPLVSDPFCPAGTVYLLHLPTLTWVDLMDWTKLQYEGSGPWRFIQDQDAYEINFGAYWNFGCLQRNTHGSITGFTDTNRYSPVM
jgi:hypothetical protein